MKNIFFMDDCLSFNYLISSSAAVSANFLLNSSRVLKLLRMERQETTLVGSPENFSLKLFLSNSGHETQHKVWISFGGSNLESILGELVPSFPVTRRWLIPLRSGYLGGHRFPQHDFWPCSCYPASLPSKISFHKPPIITIIIYLIYFQITSFRRLTHLPLSFVFKYTTRIQRPYWCMRDLYLEVRW